MAGDDLATLQTIGRICRRLDGLALAIELAAVRAATHGIDATANMLGDELCLHWPGRRTASPRQRTLKATLDWSYALLSNNEREVFGRLSALASPFSLQVALTAVADDTLDIARVAAALDELAEKSLIFPRDGHYHWSEIIRIYARVRATETRPSGCAFGIAHLGRDVQGDAFKTARLPAVAGGARGV
jgi:hypothetical protein